ncbi:MAG: type II secretion system F family protein [Candidatus Micrarchaeia archaeon]|jgi:hypothetical protein
MFERIFKALSRLFPPGVISYFDHLLLEADMDMPGRSYVGTLAFLMIMIGLAAFLLSSLLLDPFSSIGMGLLCMVLLALLFYLVPLMAADSRAKRVEVVLPDAFLMIAANIRAGMTIENAVLASAKPEFGPLEVEIKRVSTKTFAGTPLNDALMEMSNRVRSNALKRGVKLLVEGNSLGGQMASLLYEIAQDLRNQQALAREINNATMMYTIFIVFSALIASPVLFATSVYYNVISAGISKNIGSLESLPPEAMQFGSVGGIASSSGITPDDLRLFAIASILVTSFFASFTLAQIRSGKLLSGIKMMPIFVALALGIFFGTFYALETMFSSIM